MINKIEINKFKGIEKIEIDNLNKINIFIGANNSKKITILEAISLFNINDVKNLRRILSKRKLNLNWTTSPLYNTIVLGTNNLLKKEILWKILKKEI